MGEETNPRGEKHIGISNPEASIWHVGVEGAAIAPPHDAVPRRDDDDDDDDEDTGGDTGGDRDGDTGGDTGGDRDGYDPNDDGPPTT